MNKLFAILLFVCTFMLSSCETYKRTKAEKQIDTAMQRKMDQLGREIEDVGENISNTPVVIPGTDSLEENHVLPAPGEGEGFNDSL